MQRLNNTRLFSILLVYMLIWLPAVLAAKKYPFRIYSKDDGLPSSVVIYCFQDTKGFLWLGTLNGVCRFDGREFETFNKRDGMPSGAVSSILEDTNGNLWIGSNEGGIWCFTGKEFIKYSKEKGIASNTVYSMAVTRDGTLWVGTSDGLFRFDGERFHYRPIDGHPAAAGIRDLEAAAGGGLWIVGSRKLMLLHHGQVKNVARELGWDNLEIFTLKSDSKGRLWIGSVKGVYCLDNNREKQRVKHSRIKHNRVKHNRVKHNRVKHYTTRDGLGHDYVLSIDEDNMGNMWFGTRSGVSMFSGERFISLDDSNGLPDNYIYTVMQDREGNMWFCSHNDVCCLPSLNVTMFPEMYGHPIGSVNTIAQDHDGFYWLATGKELVRFNKKSFKTYTKENGLLSSLINTVNVDSKNRVWVATIRGVSVISPSRDKITNYTAKNGLSSNITYNTCETRDGSVWIGTRAGIDRVKNGRVTRPFAYEGNHFFVISIIEDRDGGVWFSSQASLHRYSGGRLASWDKDDGLTGTSIQGLLQDSRGTIWIATLNGLVSFKHNTFKIYDTGDGLPDNTCYKIIEDKNGTLWICTEKGIANFDGHRFKVFSSPLGELESGTWSAALSDRGGNLWFGCDWGVVTFRPPPYPVNTIPPPVHITRVKLLEKETPLENIRLLDYKQNYIRFDFSGICFTSPRNVTYQYRLEGLDSRWHQTKDNSIFYPYLPPGDYTFSVKAINNDGIPSTAPASVPFTIRPPFWRTWWFQALVLAAAFAGVIGFFLRRAQRAREKAELKAKKAELAAKNKQLILAQRMELMGLLASGAVHDLKNLMAVIVAYSREMEYEFSGSENSPENSSEYVGVIKETAETAASMARQILAFSKLKDGDPDNVDLGQLLGNMLESLKPSFPTGVNTRWELPPEPVYFRIDPPWFQQVILNLCLNAAQAMPGGGTLCVCLSGGQDSDVVIRVSDTGTGIDAQHLDKIFEPLFTTKDVDKGTGLGLFVVKQIVEQHGGAITVTSEMGKGTEFTISFPV